MLNSTSHYTFLPHLEPDFVPQCSQPGQPSVHHGQLNTQTTFFPILSRHWCICSIRNTHLSTETLVKRNASYKNIQISLLHCSFLNKKYYKLFICILYLHSVSICCCLGRLFEKSVITSQSTHGTSYLQICFQKGHVMQNFGFMFLMWSSTE